MQRDGCSAGCPGPATTSAQPCGCDPGLPYHCSNYPNCVWGWLVNQLPPQANALEAFRRHMNELGLVPPAGGLLRPVLAAGGLMQQFGSGATRSSEAGKADYEGFLSFPALEEFGAYMNRHRRQADGGLRDSDNWQKGIPITSYVKSMLRHGLELWGLHRGHVSQRLREEYPEQAEDLPFLKLETACALWFNVQGFIHETLKLQSGQRAA